MPKRVPQRSHRGSHISRRKGRYWYRRRLVCELGGEVCVSLRTRQFREAEHRAAILDAAFGNALSRAKLNVTDHKDLNAVLREYLRDALASDLEHRITHPPGAPLYGGEGLPGSAAEIDLEVIDYLLTDAREARDRRDLQWVETQMHGIAERFGVPEEMRQRLAMGLLELNVLLLEELRRRSRGQVPLILSPADAAPLCWASIPVPEPNPVQPDLAPAASSLVDLFEAWGRESSGWRPGAARQAKVSVHLFLEITGDKPITGYGRTDGDKFRTTLRRLPTTYRKSPEERSKSIPEIIAEADACSAPRITDKTVQRHFWGVSRFFKFLTETGRVPEGFRNPVSGFTFNKKGPARKQKEMWTGEELKSLFASPIWTGCDPHYRTRQGHAIVRDARFWLPLLALYHGNRLEEFAQLRREDLTRVEDVWCLRITDADGRQLKNQQSCRCVPLHSELIRIGFLDYVQEKTPRGRDAVFPELQPGGPDRKFGYYFSKQFSAYRKAIGVRRRGLDYHSFRHGVTTKLYEAEVPEPWIDLLTGHDEEGGESRRRYLKGISMPKLRTAIERVIWPELDFSALYIRQAEDERWPETDRRETLALKAAA